LKNGIGKLGGVKRLMTANAMGSPQKNGGTQYGKFVHSKKPSLNNVDDE
jgi:hypothetical protein